MFPHSVCGPTGVARGKRVGDATVLFPRKFTRAVAVVNGVQEHFGKSYCQVVDDHTVARDLSDSDMEGDISLTQLAYRARGEKGVDLVRITKFE